ncbi:MAG TPA: class I SAM-dependent methyltransferase [Pyrinomonadaceae bacterium]|nr:class I SAM-dependent methyltransferase [Pyrinomonadaceae bacterium]
MPTTLQESKLAYEVWHDQYDVDEDTDTPWHKLVKSHLLPERDLLGKRVLEIGCGRGGFSCWLASHSERPAEIVAADFAVTAVEKGEAFATKRGLSGMTWQVCDIQAIPHADATFDTVISCETIEHVPEPRCAILELARVLKPGGRLLLTTPNYLGPMGLYRGYLRLMGRRFTEEGQPINNFLLLPLTRSWIARTGLRVSAVDAVGHYLLLPGRLPLELRIFNTPKTLMRWFGHHSLIVAQKP